MQGSKSGKPLSGHFGLMHPTNYVKAWDLNGKDVTVIISGIYEEDLVMQGGKREKKPALTLKSRAGRALGKKLILNKTNSKLIAAATGERMVERWIGKEITIYPTTCKGQKGEETECIRVRARVNQRADEIPEDMAREPDPEPSFIDQVEGAPGDNAGAAS
jgi:hypothetical protein